MICTACGTAALSTRVDRDASKTVFDHGREGTCVVIKTLGWNSGGNYAEFYTDDDQGSGYGDHPKVARWYGTPADCRSIHADAVTLCPLDVEQECGLCGWGCSGSCAHDGARGL